MATSTHVKRTFNKAISLGSGDEKIVLSEREVFALLHKSFTDLGWDSSEIDSPPLNVAIPSQDYYAIPLKWFDDTAIIAPTADQLLLVFAKAVEKNQDFGLYFSNICALHKRRTKYQRILQRQPKPTMEQIGPRCLLEYGICDKEFLASWMVWRKWVFDIDNRSGQETGYLFEPVLASCIGGETIGARNSPIKRLNADGEATTEGRQIDCYDATSKLAYELKLRVTVAASGQGRFGEELSFPVEARSAGLTPVLVVLDPNRSNRLDELEKAFRDSGGFVYLGEQAWEHLDEKAGEIMSRFLDLYIRPPLLQISDQEQVRPQTVRLEWEENKISINIGSDTYSISRE